MSWWDVILGRKQRQQEAEAERARQTTKEAQERGLDQQAGQAPPKPIRRAEGEPRPAERAWPGHAEKFREMHDNPPPPRQEKRPEPEREATRMA